MWNMLFCFSEKDRWKSFKNWNAYPSLLASLWLKSYGVLRYNSISTYFIRFWSIWYYVEEMSSYRHLDLLIGGNWWFYFDKLCFFTLLKCSGEGCSFHSVVNCLPSIYEVWSWASLPLRQENKVVTFNRFLTKRVETKELLIFLSLGSIYFLKVLFMSKERLRWKAFILF